MPISHKKEFGIYYWDTFDNETDLRDEADTLQEAQRKVKDHFGDSIRPNGADRVDIVNSKGDVVEHYPVG